MQNETEKQRRERLAWKVFNVFVYSFLVLHTFVSLILIATNRDQDCVVGLDYGDGFEGCIPVGRGFLAAQGEVGDVDAVAAQYAAYVTDYAGDVFVLEEREMSG